jgi:hypothetical protein
MGLKIMVLAKQCKNKIFEKEQNPSCNFYMLKNNFATKHQTQIHEV